MDTDRSLSTGYISLDGVLHGLLPGDNLVWRCDRLEDLRPYISTFIARGIREDREVIYFRFADHAPFVASDEAGVRTIKLDPASGFEPFVTAIQEVVVGGSRDCVYVFDCLSELVADWFSDRMLGNFFMLTCPYVLDHGGAAYFALIRDHHSFHATDPIRQTTQILLDVYLYEGQYYVRPAKVQDRYSRTMCTLHVHRGETFVPVPRSAEAARVFSGSAWQRSLAHRLGFWSKTFAEAEELLIEASAGDVPAAATEAVADQLRRMLIARRGPVLELARKYLRLAELVGIRRRMIGTGLIGGKSVGLVIAHAVLRQHERDWDELLEPADAFFIGADVFYTFLVQNGLWWLKQHQKDPRSYLDGLTLARHQIMTGRFPEYLVRQFEDLLDYYGQVPIIVRSSSLLEDDFEGSFAGRAESVLCLNQGSRDHRREQFLDAVRRVYASNMSKAALDYRASRGMLDRDEQMAILVQRVSGVTDGRLQFPHVSGVALSFNPYVWDERIDPEAGVVRLVAGLGSRAVDRDVGDYVRLVALNAPELVLQTGGDAEYQQYVNVLDLDVERETVVAFPDLARKTSLPLELMTERDAALARSVRDMGLDDICARVLSFRGILQDTAFVPRLRELIRVLADAYGAAVDCEFAASFSETGSFDLNLLQCRPFLAEALGALQTVLDSLEEANIILQSMGPVIGRSRSRPMDCAIFVVPEIYGTLPVKSRYEVARAVGERLRQGAAAGQSTILIGPGRWGTSSPSLGVPLSVPEVSQAAVVCELAAMHEGLTPDLSLGSHFFNQLVESKALYCAVHPSREGHCLDVAKLCSAGEVTPLGKQGEAVRCILFKRPVYLTADTRRQRAVLHVV